MVGGSSPLDAEYTRSNAVPKPSNVASDFHVKFVPRPFHEI
jgi:hypothetical protein